MDYLAKKRNNKLGIQQTHFLLNVLMSLFQSAHGHVSNIVLWENCSLSKSQDNSWLVTPMKCLRAADPISRLNKVDLLIDHIKFYGDVKISTLNAPIATKVVCFSRLLKCLRSLYGKQCGPRSDCCYRSSLFCVNAVCFYTYFVSNVRQLFAADDFSRRHFQMHFFLGALRFKMLTFVLLYMDTDYICKQASF